MAFSVGIWIFWWISLVLRFQLQHEGKLELHCWCSNWGSQPIGGHHTNPLDQWLIKKCLQPAASAELKSLLILLAPIGALYDMCQSCGNVCIRLHHQLSSSAWDLRQGADQPLRWRKSLGTSLFWRLAIGDWIEELFANCYIPITYFTQNRA